MKRKSPIKHSVRKHTRQGKPVRSHTRGKGKKLRRPITFKKRVISHKNVKIKNAFALLKQKLGWVDDVRIVQQKDIKGKLISELQGWDVTGLNVHGYERKTKTIIVPDKPDTHEIIHEYGHYLYDITPNMKKVKIPASYPIITEFGKAEEYNIFHGSNDEWFAYHFAFWVAGKTGGWHKIKKEKFNEMLSKIKKKKV